MYSIGSHLGLILFLECAFVFVVVAELVITKISGLFLDVTGSAYGLGWVRVLEP